MQFTLPQRHVSTSTGNRVCADGRRSPVGAKAQAFTVLHSFTGGLEGAYPYAGFTMDKAGNLYGTATSGGFANPSCPGGCGTVFERTNKGSGWVFIPLYSFAGGNDGVAPVARVIIGPNGSLYGTTEEGGGSNRCGSSGCGTVFNLQPPAAACKTALCPWTETVLYRFTGLDDGAQPFGDLIFDQTGNLYGTTFAGGAYGYGNVFKLTPSNNGWTESVVYSFTGGANGDGAHPRAGVIFGQAGNLYGVTVVGGSYGQGTIYELTPSGSGWVETTLYSFTGESDGGSPSGGLISDASGNLYGTTDAFGAGNGGTAFQLAPYPHGIWNFSVLYGFTGQDAGGPDASLVMDAAGNLYGTTYGDGAHEYGSVFELKPSNNGWTYTSLYDFANGTDGGLPVSNVTLDASGNLFGTASSSGAYGYGVVWMIKP